MKKRQLFVLLFALAVVTAKATVVRTITTTGGQTVSELLGEEWNRVDSSAVSGPLSTEDVKTLRDCAMYGVLTGIDMSQSTLPADSLPAAAFRDAPLLRYVTLPLGLRAIGTSAFSWCRELTSVTLPQSLRFIGSSAFAFSGLAGSYTVPAGVRSIESGTFESCRHLTGLELPEGLERIESAALRFTAISHIGLPESLRHIGSCAFEGSQLERVVIPESVEEIGWGAFCCRMLESVRLPDGLREIKEETFSGAPLRQLNWPSRLEVIGQQAFAGSDLSQLVLPEGLREIGERAFVGCQYLDKAFLPASLESINESAFDNTPLSQLYCQSAVPPAVTRRTVITQAASRLWAETCSVFQTATLFVPIGSTDAYRSAYYWRDFARIVETDYHTMGVSTCTSHDSSLRIYNFYDLQGRRLSEKPLHGLYIKNGKKVQVK